MLGGLWQTHISNAVQLSLNVDNGNVTVALHDIPELERALVTSGLHYEFTYTQERCVGDPQ